MSRKTAFVAVAFTATLALAIGIRLRVRADTFEGVVLIVVDTLRADRLGCYDGATSTPHIDALARRGTRFPDVVSAFHQTTMSMAAIFSGRTPSIETGDVARPLVWSGAQWCGLARFRDPEDEGRGCVPPGLDTLASTLRAAGFHTLGVTSNPLLFEPSGYSNGFDRWIEVGRKAGVIAPPDAVTSRTGELVDRAVFEALDHRESDRFFLYVHFMDAHDYQLLGETYAEGVRRADTAVGVLLDRLAQEHLLDDALVVFTSDHGERLGEIHSMHGKPSHYGNPSFEAVLRVPLIVSPPQRSAPGFVRGQDLRSLVQRRLGLPPGPPALLRPDEILYTEEEYLTYRRFPWKCMLRRSDGELALFDLEHDPGETKDLVSHQPAVAAACRARSLRMAGELSTSRADSTGPTESDRERLRSLGYLN